MLPESDGELSVCGVWTVDIEGLLHLITGAEAERGPGLAGGGGEVRPGQGQQEGQRPEARGLHLTGSNRCLIKG